MHLGQYTIINFLDQQGCLFHQLCSCRRPTCNLLLSFNICILFYFILRKKPHPPKAYYLYKSCMRVVRERSLCGKNLIIGVHTYIEILSCETSISLHWERNSLHICKVFLLLTNYSTHVSKKKTVVIAQKERCILYTWWIRLVQQQLFQLRRREKVMREGGREGDKR